MNELKALKTKMLISIILLFIIAAGLYGWPSP